MQTPPPFSVTLSIITITRNHCDGLKRTYESLRTQDYTDYEWIVIDGASTDDTAAFLAARQNDTPTLSFTSAPDNGIYHAMNKGIARATGAYILFLNAGDALATPHTMAQIAKATKSGTAFIYGDALETSPQDATPRRKTARAATKIAWGMFTHHQAMIYRREIIATHTMHYSQRYKIASDYDFTARFLTHAAQHKHSTVIYIPHPICIFEHGGVSQQNAITGRHEQFLIRAALGITTPAKNIAIALTQTASWTLKSRLPWVYRLLRK